jgi:outer membrane protein assembly factor BamE
MRIKLTAVSILLASCSHLSAPTVPLLTPYKIEIRQGNLIAPEAREKIQFGMTRDEVRAILGTPSITDAFHANRWDYVYLFEQQGKLTERRNLTLYFDGDKLVRIEDGAAAEQKP